jgi:hypothetical protein
VTDYDRLIDDAAESMTAVPAPGDLHARVLGAIRTVRHRRAIWPWLAAAAGVILAAYLGWPKGQPVEQSTPPAVAEAPVRTAPIQVAAPPTSGRVPAPTRARQATVPRALEPTIASIPALDVPKAIGIAPLDATPESVPALDAVAPLDVEQLNIKPLTPPGQAAGGQ